MPDYKQKDRWLYDEWLHELYWVRFLTLQQVAEKVGCSDKTIEKYLKKRGDGTRPRGSGTGDYGLHDYNMLRWLYENVEYSAYQIANDLGCHRKTVESALDCAGIEMRERGGGSHYRTSRGAVKQASENTPIGITRGYEYRKKRPRVLSRDNHSCQSCGKKKDLEVHHRTPVRSFENPNEAHTMDNMVTLCSSCHLDAHGGSYK